MKNLIVKILVLGSLVGVSAFAGDSKCEKGATSEKKVLESDKIKTESNKDSTAKTGK